jgi:hypothetical protein
VGAELSQICLNVSSVCLTFDGDVQVSIESFITFGATTLQIADMHQLHSLLGKRVTRASANANGPLSLEFDGVAEPILIQRKSNGFESFVISAPGRTLVEY